jgi:hypothetical protein
MPQSIRETLISFRDAPNGVDSSPWELVHKWRQGSRSRCGWWVGGRGPEGLGRSADPPARTPPSPAAGNEPLRGRRERQPLLSLLGRPFALGCFRQRRSSPSSPFRVAPSLSPSLL